MCLSPLTMFKAIEPNESGKHSLTTDLNKAFIDSKQSIPCGQCLECKCQKARDWSVRLYHESLFHKDSCFLTLTYNNDNLPKYGSLSKKNFIYFIKKLRDHFEPLTFRYFQVGEYGKKLNRPHHHVLLFGVDFLDRKFLYEKKVKNGRIARYYTSEILDSVWPFGFNQITDLNLDTISYCARYTLKKVFGNDIIKRKYGNRVPEYITMSKGDLKRTGTKGIGYLYYQKYKYEMFSNGFVMLPNGSKVSIPKQYLSYLEQDDPNEYDLVKRSRLKHALSKTFNNRPINSISKEKILKNGLSQLERRFEDGAEHVCDTRH